MGFQLERMIWSQHTYFPRSGNHGTLLVHEGELDDVQQSLLALIRTKGFSVRYMDETKKGELRRFLLFLHVDKGLSLNDVAVLVGNKTSGYTSWLYRRLGIKCRSFEEARLKGIREKRRKYERRPFDGTDEDRAYLLGLRHGDLSVSKPWKDVVRVSTSTTHPAMANLFRSLFEPNGHVYQHPRYKKDTKSYEWNLSVILDNTFEFMFLGVSDVKDWISTNSSLTLAYLSGLLDAEGSVVTTRNKRGNILLFAAWNNSNLALLAWVRERLRFLSYPTSLCLNKRKGVRSKKYGIIHRQDYWQLSIFGTAKVQQFLRSIRPKHDEKLRRMRIALSVTKGQSYSEVFEELAKLRADIKSEVIAFVQEAELQYLKTHPPPAAARPPCSQ